MVRAWIEAPGYDRSRGSAIAWLVALTRNRAIDVIRARGRRSAYENEAGESPPDAPATPESAVSDAQRADAVRSALGLLTEDQRRALDLSYFGGLSHSEIAERLGQPLGTVKTRIAQAVRKLREALAQHRRSG
jgi:RNA polymerase sigma-70 factor (ECF subfamily)